MKLDLITYGLGNIISVEKIRPIKNREFVKPEGGLWASPINSQYGWKEWCLDNDFGNLKSYFVFSIDGNILVIDCLQDAQEKLRWRRFYEHILFPDFESLVMQGIDAIHLTDNGERETRYSHPYSLYGWDCESVLIMNPKIICPT